MHQARIALAVMILAGGFSLLGLAAPGCTYACSCAEAGPIAAYAREPDTVILSGTVTAMGEDLRGTFRVARWYLGSSESVDLPIKGDDGKSCGIELLVGQQLVMVASVGEGFLYPSGCAPHGDLATPEGRQVEAEAIAAFGGGTVPTGAEAASGGSPDGDGVPEIVILGGAFVLGILALVAGASFVSGRRA